MKTKTKFSHKILSVFLAITILFGVFPIAHMGAAADTADTIGIVTDPGTADSWEHMMGTESDGNRYAGRVWVDKSVYKERSDRKAQQ